jgi:hypothetical protein
VRITDASAGLVRPWLTGTNASVYPGRAWTVLRGRESRLQRVKSRCRFARTAEQRLRPSGELMGRADPLYEAPWPCLFAYWTWTGLSLGHRPLVMPLSDTLSSFRCHPPVPRADSPSDDSLLAPSPQAGRGDIDSAVSVPSPRRWRSARRPDRRSPSIPSARRPGVWPTRPLAVVFRRRWWPIRRWRRNTGSQGSARSASV